MAALKASWVEISKIELHQDLQPRVERPAGAVEEYAELIQNQREVDQDHPWPFNEPVILYSVGGAKFLTSGWTRLEAAKHVGLKCVYAEVRKGEWLDAVTHACGANADHGYRRTTKDKRRAVEILLRNVSSEDQSWSDQRVADECRVSPGFVSSIRSVLEQTGSVAASPVRVDKRGSKRAAKKPEAKTETKPARKPRTAGDIVLGRNQPRDEPSEPESSEPENVYADLGECPVCNALNQWILCDDGYECDKCGHPHGVEPGVSGDEEEWEDVPEGSGTATATRTVSAKQLKKAKTALGTLTRSTTAIGLEHELESYLRAIHDQLALCEPDE